MANSAGSVRWWSQIWKENPNLENILENPRAGQVNFAVWNCQIARRRGEMEVGS